MTRRMGDFADRGVHLRTKSGRIIPLPTPSIAELRCVGCRAKGVTVIQLGIDTTLGWLNQKCWCDLPCAHRNGFRFPPSEAPKPSRRSAQTRSKARIN